jgi:hypothetical protein
MAIIEASLNTPSKIWAAIFTSIDHISSKIMR